MHDLFAQCIEAAGITVAFYIGWLIANHISKK